MDLATIMTAIRVAATAATEAKSLWDQFHGTMDEADQAVLKKHLDNLRAENEALYEVTLAKLDEASKQS